MENIKKLKKELEKALNKLSKVYASAPLDMDYNQYQSYFDPFTNKIDELSQKVRLLEQDFEMREIPSYGNLMDIETFKGYCEDGGFIDSDGSGNYATKNKMSDISIYPSDITEGMIREDFTHVVWFNK